MVHPIISYSDLQRSPVLFHQFAIFGRNRIVPSFGRVGESSRNYLPKFSEYIWRGIGQLSNLFYPPSESIFIPIPGRYHLRLQFHIEMVSLNARLLFGLIGLARGLLEDRRGILGG